MVGGVIPEKSQDLVENCHRIVACGQNILRVVDESYISIWDSKD